MDLSKHLDKAAEAVKRRNYPYAIKMYGQLCALQPDNAEARAGLRTALFKKAETKPVPKLFALLGGGIHLLTASISRMTGGHAGAAKALERYLVFDPLNEGANLRLGDSLVRSGSRRSALAVYKAYAEQQPRCLDASRSAGALLHEAGELEAALGMYEQALRVDPRDQESLKAKKNLAAEGALLSSNLEGATSSRELIKDKQEQKRLERADRLQLSPEEIEQELEELEGRLAEDPDDVATLRRLARVHEMNRDQQSALDCLERAVALAPDDHELADRVGDLRIAMQEARIREAEARGDDGASVTMRRVLAELSVGEVRRRDRAPTDRPRAPVPAGQFPPRVGAARRGDRRVAAGGPRSAQQGRGAARARAGVSSQGHSGSGEGPAREGSRGCPHDPRRGGREGDPLRVGCRLRGCRGLQRGIELVQTHSGTGHLLP